MEKRLQQRKKKRLQSPKGFGWSPKWWLVWGMFPPNGCSSQTDCSRKCRPITIWCSSYYQVMPLKIPVRGDKFAINHFFGVNFCKIIWYKLLHHIAIEEKTHLIVPLKKISLAKCFFMILDQLFSWKHPCLECWRAISIIPLLPTIICLLDLGQGGPGHPLPMRSSNWRSYQIAFRPSHRGNMIHRMGGPL